MEAVLMNRFLTQFGFLSMGLVGLMLFIGCGEDDPNNPSTSEVTIPGVGTIYTYTDYETENNVKVDSTEQTVTAEVLETGLSFKSKTGVVHIQEIGTLDPTDTTHSYLKYENNNDVSVWLDIGEEADIDGIDPSWIVLPFGSKSNQTLTLIDTVVDNGVGGKADLQLIITTSWVREETAQIQGNELKIWVGRLNTNWKLPFLGTIEGSTDFFFAPEIGFIYRSEEQSQVVGAGDPTGFFRQLISYVLK